MTGRPRRVDDVAEGVAVVRGILVGAILGVTAWALALLTGALVAGWWPW